MLLTLPSTRLLTLVMSQMFIRYLYDPNFFFLLNLGFKKLKFNLHEENGNMTSYTSAQLLFVKKKKSLKKKKRFESASI